MNRQLWDQAVGIYTQRIANQCNRSRRKTVVELFTYAGGQSRRYSMFSHPAIVYWQALPLPLPCRDRNKYLKYALLNIDENKLLRLTSDWLTGLTFMIAFTKTLNAHTTQHASIIISQGTDRWIVALHKIGFTNPSTQHVCTEHLEIAIHMLLLLGD